MGNEPFRSRQAVLIGNSRFDAHPRIHQLPAAAASLTAMASLLTGDRCGWAEDEITVLSEISDPAALARLVVPAVRGVNDLLFVYYVGHGLQTMEAQLALALGGTDPHVESLPYTGMLYENLAKIIQGSPARTKLVVLDCCFAELANKANYQIQPAETSTVSPYGGLYFIGASKAFERAQAPVDGSPTYFTQAFVDVVGKGVAGKPETLSIEQIFQIVDSRLRAAGLAEPVDSGIRGARNTPFARNAARFADGTGDVTFGDVETVSSVREPTAGPSRRRVLVVGGVGASAAVLGGGWFGLHSWLSPGTAKPTKPSGPPVSRATALEPPLSAHTDMVTSVCFSPDGTRLASGSYDRSVRLWNVTAPTRAKPVGAPLTGHTNHVTSVCFSPDGKSLASASEDTTVRLWKVVGSADSADSAVPGSVLTGHEASVNAVVFSGDGSLMASGSDDASIRLWSIPSPATGRFLGGLVNSGGDTAVVVRSVAFTSGNTGLASGNGDSTVALWHLGITAPALFGTPLSAGTGIVNSVAVSPNGQVLAAAGFDQVIRLWDISNPARPVAGRVLVGHTDAITSVAFSPNGDTLASTGYDRTIRLWDVSDPTRPQSIGQPLTGHAQAIFCVAFNLQGTLLASASGDTTVRLWSLS